LCDYFSPDHEVIVLHRGKTKTENGVHFAHWDARTKADWMAHLEHADVLINLVGRSVDCRYNEKNKKEIMESRIASTHILGEALQESLYPPAVWINSASATIYRHSEDKEMDETTGEIGSGFSVDVCNAWEKTFFDFKLSRTRQVAMRTAIVLGRKGGALKPLINLARIGLGGKQGSGSQFFSWVHETDFARAIEFIIMHEKLTGPVNIVSPKPTTNAEIMCMIRRSIKIPFGLPMPEWMLKMGARIIRTEAELILKSRNVIPVELLKAGFKHAFPDLKTALDQIINAQK